MKVITWNVNGLRAVEKKGALAEFISKEDPDILMLQEIKATEDQLQHINQKYDYYHHSYHSAEKKGYAGTAIWVKSDLYTNSSDISWNFKVEGAPNQDEGRMVHLTIKIGSKKWSFLSIYFPNGGKSDLAWQEKLVFYEKIRLYINQLAKTNIVVLGGDMNVAHRAIDLARPKDNDGKIGFHPSERVWMDRLEGDGWIDVWRYFNPKATGVYSWWNMVTRSRSRNVGWRIDYFIMPQQAAEHVQDSKYLTEQMGSDHCPLAIELRV